MKCKKCNGTGLETYMSEPGLYEQNACPECNGRGEIDEEDNVNTVKGEADEDTKSI